MSKIEDTLAQRGAEYGDFREQGRITQNLKRAMQDSPNWHKLPGYIKEGLDMIVHKISRLLNGNPLYDDNVHDILGYGKLMQDRMAQDREAGVVIQGGGDPLYPAYQHEERAYDPVAEGYGGVDPNQSQNLGIPMINEFSFIGTLNRTTTLLSRCRGQGGSEVAVDKRDLENLLHLARIGIQK